MKLITLAKKEAQDILRNKIYLLVVFVQVFIIFGAFGLAVASSIAMDPNLLDSYGLSSSLKVGISQDLNGSALAKDLEAQNLNLICFKDMNQANNLLGTRLVAVVEVSSQPKQDVTVHMDTANVFYPVVSTKVNSAVNKFKVEKRLESAGVNDSDIQKVQNLVTLNVVGVKTNQDAGIALDSPYFVEIMYGFIVPFILLLPIFLAGNIVTDSIVGERERKTFEILLMAPISSSMVILGKTLPILIFSLVQSIAWMLILEILHVPVYNSFALIFILFFVGLGFIGAGIFISMLVDSTKEANSAITMLLVFATFLLFMPLFINSSYFEGILNFIPTVLMVKLASTPNINPEIMLLSLPTVFLSSLIFLMTVRYFKHERTIRL
jgi:ABC-2 type transport system permease protein